MDRTTTLDLEKVHPTQLLHHVVNNKLMLPLTVLGELAEGRPVTPDLLKQAISELEAVVRFVKEGKEPEA